MNASLAKLLECYLCFVALLSYFFVWLAFWRGKFGKGTYTKVITHPHSLLIITYKKKLAELRNGVKKGSMAGTSKELRAVALTSYCYFLLLFSKYGSFPVTGKEIVHLFLYRVT